MTKMRWDGVRRTPDLPPPGIDRTIRDQRTCAHVWRASRSLAALHARICLRCGKLDYEAGVRRVPIKGAPHRYRHRPPGHAHVWVKRERAWACTVCGDQRPGDRPPGP